MLQLAAFALCADIVDDVTPNGDVEPCLHNPQPALLAAFIPTQYSFGAYLAILGYDTSRPNELQVTLRRADDAIVGCIGPVVIPRPEVEDSALPEACRYVSFVLRFQNIRFETEGLYQLQIVLNGSHLADQPIPVFRESTEETLIVSQTSYDMLVHPCSSRHWQVMQTAANPAWKDRCGSPAMTLSCAAPTRPAASAYNKWPITVLGLGSVNDTERDRAEALERLRRIANLPDDWNLNGAPAFSISLIDRARSLVRILPHVPFVMGTAVPSIQMNYEEDGKGYLQFDLLEDGTIEQYREFVSGKVAEAVVDVDGVLDTVRDFFGSWGSS